MRENRPSGSMKGRREQAEGTGNYGLFNPLCPRPPTLQERSEISKFQSLLHGNSVSLFNPAASLCAKAPSVF